MEFIGSIQAALKANAPVVALPVEGKTPVCISRNLLAGALKGVTVLSVEVTCEGSARWLHIRGRAGKSTRTYCKIPAMARHEALAKIGAWRDSQIRKAHRIALQGVLSPDAQRELKLKATEKAGIAELIQAKQDEAEILAQVKQYAKQELHPIAPEDRAELMQSYLAFRRGNRKVASVILYKIVKIQEQLDALTERKIVHHRGRGRNRGPVEHINRVRKAKDVALVAELIVQIGALKAEFDALYPPVWVAPRPEHEWDRGRWQDTFVKQRPKGGWAEWQVYGSDGSGRWGQALNYDRKALARRLREVRADIRALTPPKNAEDMPIAT